ncbi:MAG TPA: sulfotransferase, partial [Gammaproteobacteria bacterium]|nr:sulfotransferase [Gammaproteobacteria bacterium]
YVEKARQESAALGGRALEIRFEDLLREPERVVPEVARFCRVPAPANQRNLLEGLETGRAFAFRRDPELVAFAASVPEVLGRYGYAP